MHLTNTDSEYGLVAKVLHWSIAVLVLLQFAGGIAGIDDAVHATAGLTVLVLVTIRLVWRLFVSLPDWAPSCSLRASTRQRRWRAPAMN